LKPWDFAAASLMIEEAGGRISLWDGNPLDIFSPSSVLGSNKWLHPTMLRLIKG
jgi:myo-inositol-1(or 4)-monophosphatase